MKNDSAKDIVETFYTAFQRKDGDSMAACYHPDVVFSDPVFPRLSGVSAGDMWRMLCESGKDLEINFEVVSESTTLVEVDWQARYTFSKTGRRVLNRIRGNLRVEEGKIIEHTDSFSFWRWSSQALGPAGLLLGWTPMLQRKVQGAASESLRKYQESKQ